MQRRTFLTAAAGSLLASSAGCLGYTVESEEDVARREDRLERQQRTIDEQNETIGEQNETIGEQQSTLEERKSELERRQTRIEELESETNRLEGDVERLHEEKVSEYYALAIEYSKAGGTQFGEGIDYYGDETYILAYEKFALAEAHYDDAASAADRALTIAQEESFSSVVTPLTESHEVLAGQSTACKHYKNAAFFYHAGDPDQGGSYEQDAIQALQSVEGKDIASTDEIDDALGL